MMYDLAIIGGGPAGVAAGVYAARKRLKTIFITADFMSQSTVSEGIENWIGTKKISGADFAKALEEHLREYSKDIVDIKTGEWVKKVEKSSDGFSVATDQASYGAKTILITTGGRRRKLEVPGAEQFENKGITYCASCDGPLFAGKDVAVIGGGNAAFETAAQLLAYCPKVTLINRSDSFRADPETIEKLSSNPKLVIVKNAILKEIKGEKFVKSLVYTKDGKDTELPVEGIFAEIGSLPNTDFVTGLVAFDQWNHIVVDPRNQRTNVPGIWAAGDATDGLYHQNNIAAGDAVKALEDIYLSIHAKK